MDILRNPGRIIKHFNSDSLFRNSVYLMLSTVVQAVLGFGFWLLCSRLFTPGQIGLASGLISASTFIAYLSLLGFNSSFIRFLPTSKRRNDKLNTGLILSLSVALIFGIGYIALVPTISPKLAFVHANHLYAVAFIVLSALGAINLLTDSAFIAYRASKYNLIIYSIQSTLKLLLPVAMIGFGAFGVFAASGAAAAIALFLSLFFLATKFDYKPKLTISKGVLQNVWRFSSATYLANLLNIVPTLVLPVLIINYLGETEAGYFYLAFMLANLVYAIAYAVSQSLFAEGSYGEGGLLSLVKRASLFLFALMVPAGIGLAVLGPFILLIFGHSYDGEAGRVLVVLALSAPAVAGYVLGGVLLRLAKQIVSLVVVNVIYAVSICGLAILWTPRGVVWAAGAWLVGNVITTLVSLGLVAYLYLRRKSAPEPI